VFDGDVVDEAGAAATRRPVARLMAEARIGEYFMVD
jgi:hypothetical protein